MIDNIIVNIVAIIMCHAVGDYLFQSDYIARYKGNNWYILFIHCVLYCVPFALAFDIDWKLAVLFGTHFVIDMLKARYKRINIVVDQVLHYAIALVLYIGIWW